MQLALDVIFTVTPATANHSNPSPVVFEHKSAPVHGWEVTVMQSAMLISPGIGWGIEMAPLLTESECADIRSTLYKLKTHWYQRTPILPFYTLGAASYLDAKTGEDGYIEKADHYNAILRQHFSGLYERLQQTLETKLGQPAVYKARAGLPGFYIFLAHRAYAKMSPSIHTDCQYRNLDWSWAQRISQPISYTLAISLPHEGSGINVWNLTGMELAGLPQEEVDRLLRQADKRFVAYRMGWLTLQVGHLLHQISPPTQVLVTDERITVQGHGLLCDGTFQLYW